MHVLHEAAVDSEHAEGLQLVVAQHRAVVTQDQLGVAVAALHEGRGGTPSQVRQRHARNTAELPRMAAGLALLLLPSISLSSTPMSTVRRCCIG